MLFYFLVFRYRKALCIGDKDEDKSMRGGDSVAFK